VSTTPSSPYLTWRRLTTSTRINNCNCRYVLSHFPRILDPQLTMSSSPLLTLRPCTLIWGVGRPTHSRASQPRTGPFSLSQKLRQRINSLVHLTRTQRSHPWLRSRAPAPRTAARPRLSPGSTAARRTSPRWVASPHLKGWGSCRHVACDGAREAACCAPQRGRRALFGAVETIGVRVRAGRVVKCAKGAPSGGRGCV